MNISLPTDTQLQLPRNEVQIYFSAKNAFQSQFEHQW